MKPRSRVRGVGLLCCHCIRNLAYYRAGWIRHRFASKDDFWRTVNSNFLDIGVLEWCKLFSEKRGKHHWSRVVPERDAFEHDLFMGIDVTEEDFEMHRSKMKVYRDKFVAHLDEEPIMDIPKLDVAITSAEFLYKHVYRGYPGFLSGLPNPEGLYELHLAHGRHYYPSEKL